MNGSRSVVPMWPRSVPRPRTAHADEHQLLMPGAVVVHDRQHRQLMVLRRPQHARRVIQIAVGLHVDHDLLAALRGECGADGCRRAVAHAGSALSAKIAAACRDPTAARCGHPRSCWVKTGSILVNDERPELGIDAGRADWRGVPTGTTLFERTRERLNPRRLIGRRVLRAALRDDTLLVGTHLLALRR